MTIYRGIGGGGNATSDSEINELTTLSTAAAASETSAGVSAAAAGVSAGQAATSANAASTSAATATTQATNASTSAAGGATSASNAATSAAAALASKNAAAASEATASTAATTATTQAGLATTNGAAQVALATTQAGNAAASASSASTQAGLATTNGAAQVALATTQANNSASSASTATTKASEAATSATNAATSETNAASSASAASSSASSASASADAALTALDNFDDRYLGQKASDPTVDNDGNALIAGALYFNTTDSVMKVYEGSVWVAAYASLSGALLKVNNLSDVASVTGARTNLGLGTAATTAATAYATAAQGATADTAVQPNDTVSFAGLTYTGTLTGGTGVVNIGSGQVYKDASGNVGIGTSSPASTLHLSAPDPVVRLQSNTASGVRSAEIQFYTASGSKIGTIGASPYGGAATLYNDVPTGWNYKWKINSVAAMTLDSAGSVGIGVTNPQGKFEVSGGRSWFTANSEVYSVVMRYSSGTNPMYIGATNSATPSIQFSNSGGGNIASIDYSGNVTAPSFIGALNGNATTATTATNVSGGSGAFGGLINTKTNNAAFAGSNDSTLSVRGDGTYGAVMSFHRAGAFAANFGLDTDNVLKYGGWSAGAVHPVYHGGNPQVNITGNAATATNAAGAFTVPGVLTVGNSTNSSISMVDTDEGTRAIHCNSNRIGFLNQAGGWGSYCNDDGSWASVGSMTATSFNGSGAGLTGVPGFGVGQTWQAVSRSSGVAYTNSTGKPIQIVIHTTSGGTGQLVVGGVVLTRASNNFWYTATVPNGTGYSFNGGWTIWVELR